MYEQEKITKKAPGNKRRTLVITTLVILLFLGITYFIVKSLKAPAQGSIQQTPASEAEKTVPYSQPGYYKGKYVAFNYPAYFKKQPAQLTGSYLETVAYASTDLSYKQINVGVSKSSITSDGSVAYRRKHPELYKETTSSKWIEFIKTDGTEDTFFIENGGLLASVSASAHSANLNGEALYVASGLKWL